ncbi:MAG: tetratricopeptide repeat protein [Treponema sp.]|jgi:tetratricopeptide (TPR) repeat protein|nr:tetratricopeptide repeat protein [Treponema sp.]
MLRRLRSDRDEAEVIVAEMAGLFAYDDARDAVEDLTRAIEINPDDEEAYYQRGLARTLLGEKNKALEDYEQTIALNPVHGKAAGKRDCSAVRLRRLVNGLHPGAETPHSGENHSRFPQGKVRQYGIGIRRALTDKSPAPIGFVVFSLRRPSATDSRPAGSGGSSQAGY